MSRQGIGLAGRSAVKLPLDQAVTQSIAILGRKGMGKTFTSKVFIEEMLEAELPIVVLDPMGVYWGLRVGEGKHKGYPVTILGGEHGDIPLEPTAGKVIADVVVEHPGGYVLDLSLFDSDAMEDRFAEDFASRLFRAKAKDRSPMMLVVDEADRYAPQRPMPGQQRMLGAFSVLMRRARIRGLGMTVLTQRPASLNKNVLTMCEVLVVHQITSPQDRNAVDEWVKLHGTKEEREEFLVSLSKLHKGEAWLWSPEWLQVFERITVRRLHTVDSSKTPEPGDAPIESRRMEPVDLKALEKRMAATIQKAKADDPGELRKEIRQLRSALDEANRLRPEPKVETKVEIQYVDLPVLDDKINDSVFDAMLRVEKVGQEFQALANDVIERLKTGWSKDVAPKARGGVRQASGVGVATRPVVDERRPSKRPTPDVASNGQPEISDYAMSLLRAVAARHPMKLTRAQISTLSGRSPRSSAFSTAMKEIVDNGWVYSDGKLYGLSERAMEHVDLGVTVYTGDVIEMWIRALPAYEESIFKVLVAIHPNDITREHLAAESGRSITSSAFNGAISTLVKNGLAVVSSGLVRASDDLFI